MHTHIAFQQKIYPREFYAALKIRGFTLVFALLASGCVHRYYAPNVHNVPLFQRKEEARVSIGYSGGDEVSGVDFQTAVSVTNRIGLMANGAWRNGGEGEDQGNGHLLELGAGYFQPIGRKGVFEIYGGVGGGSVENQYGSSSFFYQEQGSSSVKFTRYFIQPSIGYTSEHFDMALSSRFCKLGFNDFYASSFSQPNPLSELQAINNRQSYLLFEPALTLRGGWNNFKVQAQLGLSYNLTSPDFAQEVTNLTIGAYLNIAKKARPMK